MVCHGSQSPPVLSHPTTTTALWWRSGTAAPGDQVGRQQMDRALLVRHDEAERLDTLGVTLYADHTTTGGALSGNRAFLPAGTDGPPPHFHRTSAELFYMLGGTLRVLAGEEIVVVNE